MASNLHMTVCVLRHTEPSEHFQYLVADFGITPHAPARITRGLDRCSRISDRWSGSVAASIGIPVGEQNCGMV